MNNSSKLIVFIIICLGLWFLYDKFANINIDLPKLPETTQPNQKQPVPDVTEPVNKPKKTNDIKEQETEQIYVYLLTTDKSGNQFLKPVTRNLPSKEDKLSFAIEQLISGPTNAEKNNGFYSEIPETTVINSISATEDKVIIDLSNSFQLGGGSDSTYSRMRQLIKTVLINSNKQTYLYLDGKPAEVIGGEGISITQPLSEKSLDE